MSARVAMWCFIAAVLALFGVVAYLSPLSQTDWDYLVWITQHRRHSTGDWLATFFTRQHTFTDATSILVVRSPIAFAILTPVLALAAVWGTFTMAMRRLPRFDAWADVGGVIVIAALLWIAAPRCGLTYFQRAHSIPWLGGTALTLWYLAPLRCGWRLRGWQVALVVLAGFLAATSTRQLGMVVTVATIYAIMKRGERPVWLWLALAAVAFGTALGFMKVMFDYRGLKPGFELSLVQLNLPIFEGGELISFVGALVLVKIVVGTLWPKHAGERSPDTRETLGWFGVWFGYILIALLGPRYAEASLYPAAVVLVVAVFPVVQWTMTSRPLHIAVLAIAVAINLVAWSYALSTYINAASEYRERRAALREAPRNSVATVKTYAQIRPEFWAYGEDWQDAARRQYLARTLFKLEDIQMSPAFRRLEQNPKLEMHLETEGLTPEQLRAANAPEKWASTIRNARIQFDELVSKLGANGPFTLRLVVDKLPYEILNGRPLLAASFENGHTTSARVRRTPQDEESKQAILPTPASLATRFPESYTVIGGRAQPVKFARRRYLVQTVSTELHAVVACDPSRCFLVDAFIPAL
ncbi:MAG: DUF6056 family protein [Myxococcota bacterium]|nr:DUF6056 family protein [Myxococcota bacterium]